MYYTKGTIPKFYPLSKSFETGGRHMDAKGKQILQLFSFYF